MTQFIQIEEIRRRPHDMRRLALWDLGFRPFYLLASIHAAASVLLWVAYYAGLAPWAAPVALPGPLGHAHEMLFGFAAAVIVGFLFTAGRNWSGQRTPTGWRLAALAAVWLAARVLAYTPWTLAAGAANAAFLAGAAWGLGRALLRGPNRRNHFFIALLLALGTVSTLVHLGQAGWLPATGNAAVQIALDLVLFIMAVMAGRVLPMFTNNALRVAGAGAGAGATRHPAVERAALGSTLALLVLDMGRALGGVMSGPAGQPGTDLALGVTVALCWFSAAAHAARWCLWRPWRTLGQPLVWVLHLAIVWVPVHLALRGSGELGWVAPALATHALTVGAMGGLIIGMMTRTARGHTAAALVADRWDVLAYALVAAAAVLRVGLPLVWPPLWQLGTQAAALAWAGGFAVYAWRYAPALMRPRQDGLPDS